MTPLYRLGAARLRHRFVARMIYRAFARCNTGTPSMWHWFRVTQETLSSGHLYQRQSTVRQRLEQRTFRCAVHSTAALCCASAQRTLTPCVVIWSTVTAMGRACSLMPWVTLLASTPRATDKTTALVIIAISSTTS